jgi:hypothetical protein
MKGKRIAGAPPDADCGQLCPRVPRHGFARTQRSALLTVHSAFHILHCLSPLSFRSFEITYVHCIP